MSALRIAWTFPQSPGVGGLLHMLLLVKAFWVRRLDLLPVTQASDLPQASLSLHPLLLLLNLLCIAGYTQGCECWNADFVPRRMSCLIRHVERRCLQCLKLLTW